MSNMKIVSMIGAARRLTQAEIEAMRVRLEPRIEQLRIDVDRLMQGAAEQQDSEGCGRK